MRIELIKIVFVFVPLFCFGQTGHYYAGITASKEFDAMNLNQPMGIQAALRLWPIYLQAEYKFDIPRITPFQVTQSTASYGGRMGVFFNNKKSSELSGVALHAGILNREEYKKIIFTSEEYPIDALGNTLEVDKVQVRTQGVTYVIGITVLQLIVDDGKKLSSFLDDYDIKLLKKKKRYNTIRMTLEAMFQPKVDYQTSMKYNPYNFYVDRELFFKPAFKQRKFGVNLHLEYAGPLHIGLFMQLGVFPGIVHKSEDYFDFNLACRFGAIVNVGFFKKKDE